MTCSVGTAATSFTGLGMAVLRVIFCPSLTPHRFSAFWLRSKCSICSYQLNIWYEDHVSSSILNGFLQGMERQELAPVPWRVGLALQYRKDRLTPLTTESLANQHQMVISTYIRQWARIILAICNDHVRICHHFYMRQFQVSLLDEFPWSICMRKWKWFSNQTFSRWVCLKTGRREYSFTLGHDKIILHRIISVVWLTNFLSEIRSLSNHDDETKFHILSVKPFRRFSSSEHWWSLVLRFTHNNGCETVWVA